MLNAYMRLTIAFSPCNPRKWDVLSRFDSPLSLFENIDLIKGKLTDEETSSLEQATQRQADAMLEYCGKRGINVYCYEDTAYPEKLRRISDPPSVLFTLGRLEDIDFSKAATVIGARKADSYSLKCAQSISAGLVKNGVVIVSGFAIGTDSAAHSAAIQAGGKTVAVLGCGLEYDYPSGSWSMKHQISKSGAVISEYFPAARPAPENFKVRNRICSALSDCIICTQASAKSGSLNTVSHGIEQGKDIFVTPPHDIFSPDYQGIISLLRDGAQQIYSADDVISALYL